MAGARPEPFHLALASLRERLRTGALAPGARVAAVELADSLGLSATPVREALSRLAGEGLLEDRRGQGYFVRLPGAADIADLYRLSLAHLLIAAEPRRLQRLPAAPRPGPPVEAAGEGGPFGPVDAVEALFRSWVAASGSRALVTAFRIVQLQLGPVRRLEGAVLGDLAGEARALAGLAAAPRAERLAGLRRFHAARIREAGRLAGLLESVSRAART
jgi:DNA-binding Lrp family transcriptional regulator